MPAGGQASVAIPVRDGGAVFGDMLDAVLSQRLDRPMEVVVADSGSTDGTREFAGIEVSERLPPSWLGEAAARHD